MNGAMEVGGLRKFAAIFLATLLLACGAAIARAEEEPVFTIEFKDGAVSPQRLEIAAYFDWLLGWRGPAASALPLAVFAGHRVTWEGACWKTGHRL